MKGYEAVAEILASRGCTDLFGVLGEGNLLLAETLARRHGVRFVAARHEAGAVAMADGWARVSGRAGYATVTHGPGVTNAMTSLVAATRHGTPLVVAAGALPTKAQRHVQYLDQRAVLEAAGVPVVALETDGLSSVAAAVDRVVEEGTGPVVLDLGTDRQDANVQAEPPLRTPRGHRPAPFDEGAVADAVRVLEGSRRPVVLAGRGALDALDELRMLADRLGAMLATTLLANGAFGDDEWQLGVVGGLGRPEHLEWLRRADVVLAAGASLNHLTTQGGDVFPDAALVHVDVDADALGAWVAPAVPVLGDAATVARHLISRLKPRTGWRTQTPPTRTIPSPPLGAGVGTLPPLLVLHELDRLLPHDRTLVVDGGQTLGLVCQGLAVHGPRRFVLATDFGALGQGVAMATGAALAHPDAPTVLGVGDGGLLMGLVELETAVRLGVDLVVVVLNDEAYGAEVHQLRSRGLDDGLARFPGTPSLADVAAGLGAGSVRLTSTDDLDRLPGVLARRRGPLLVEVCVEGALADWFAPLLHR